MSKNGQIGVKAEMDAVDRSAIDDKVIGAESPPYDEPEGDETSHAVAELALKRAEAAAQARARVPRYFLATLAANAVHATLECVGEYRWGERATETSRLIEAALTRLLDDVGSSPPSGQERGFSPETGAGTDTKISEAIKALKAEAPKD
jgi:hypothetical protein